MNYRILGMLLFFVSINTWAESKIIVGIASKSTIKRSAVKKAFKKIFPSHKLVLKTYEANSQIAEQPVHYENGKLGADNRFQFLETQEKDFDYLISVESFIQKSDQSNEWFDQAIVLLRKNNQEKVYEVSKKVFFDLEYLKKLQNYSIARNIDSLKTGYPVTIGKIIKKNSDKKVLENNWHEAVEFGGVSRDILIADAIVRAIIKSEIKAIENFKPGVSFKDVTSLLSNSDVFSTVINLFVKEFENKKIDAVVGLEARGFYFAPILAHILKKPFIPARKKDKLPGKTYGRDYSTEYSHDRVEILADSVDEMKGKTILIIDDLLATGGTIHAVEEIFKDIGIGKIYSACVIELLGLNGKSKLNSEFFSIVQY